MAKRKRLTPAKEPYIDSEMPVLETKSFGIAPGSGRAPIAQVAGEASAASALQDLAGEVKRAKDSGRMILDLSEAVVEAGYLVRDRMMADEEELQVLMESLRARGQQTPIEVVQLDADRYGLISGWRRLTAIRRLLAETGDTRFATIQALIRQPETADDAYVAMVEENEIRVGLTYYERARVAAKAVEQNVYAHEREALQALFSTASRAKRSKIGTFLKLYHALDADLKFPAAIPERLGIALVKALDDDPEFGQQVRVSLRNTDGATAETEVAVLERMLAGQGQKQTLNPHLESNNAAPEPRPANPTPPRSLDPLTFRDHGMVMRFENGKLTLSGPSVTADFRARLQAWVRDGGKSGA